MAQLVGHQPLTLEKSQRRAYQFFRDLQYLWLEQVSEVWASWYWYVILSLLAPLGLMFGFTRVASGLTDRPSLIYILSAPHHSRVWSTPPVFFRRREATGHTC